MCVWEYNGMSVWKYVWEYGEWVCGSTRNEEWMYGRMDNERIGAQGMNVWKNGE